MPANGCKIEDRRVACRQSGRSVPILILRPHARAWPVLSGGQRFPKWPAKPREV